MGVQEKEIKVSVIIPVYNTEKYLPQCLESLENQTLKNFEMICVDDGSKDGSLDIIREFQKKDRRLILLTEENKGGGAARNLGLSKARGKYLSFLDSDDYFEPDMLKKMADKLDATGSDICVAKVRCWHEDLGFFTDEYSAMRDEFLPEKDVFSYKDMPETIFNTFHNWPWNKMFRKSFVEENGLSFQEIRRTNDLFFTCAALVKAEKITTVKENLINYRVGISGNCQSTNASFPLDFYEAFRKVRGYLLEQGIYEMVKRSFVNHALDGCIANLLSQEGGPEQETLYHQLKGGLFKDLDIDDQGADYFYPFNQRMYQFYRTIMEKDYSTFLRLRIRDLKEERDRCLKMNHIEKMGIIRKNEELRDEAEELRDEADMWHQRMEETYASFSYKTGHAVTAPIRAVGRVVRREKHSKK